MPTKRKTDNLITIETKPDPQIATQTLALRTEALAVKITTPAECVAASEFLSRVQKVRRWVSGIFDSAKKPLNTAKRDLDKQQRESVGALESIEAEIEARILAFREQERLERERIARQERERRETEARAEQEQRAAELRKAAEDAPSKKVARLLEEQANIIASAPPVIDHVVPSADEPELLAVGIHERQRAHAAVHNRDALVLQVAAQEMIRRGAPTLIAQWLQQFKPHPQASMDCLVPAMPKLNTLAKGLKSDFALEGVSVEIEASLVSRS